ncbi:MAG: hypothetical protein V7643_2887, partial [Mycobacterium sp.]
MTTTQQRRLRQSCLVSVNGVFTEPLAWAGPYFGPGSAASSLAALEDSGALLMGRRTYEISAVTELKRAAGKDLIVYGHGRLGQTLCDAGLVDQLTLTIAPVFVASGSPLFQPG